MGFKDGMFASTFCTLKGDLVNLCLAAHPPRGDGHWELRCGIKGVILFGLAAAINGDARTEIRERRPSK